MKSAIINAKLYVEHNHFVQALLIQDGIITKIGQSEEILALVDEDTTLLDAKGKTILPGLNDSHMHLMHTGEYLSLCDMHGARSIDEVVARGKKFLEDHPEVQVMRGIGYNQNHFVGKQDLLNRHDLDRISTTIPIVIHRVCNHIASANTVAIARCGIDGTTPQIPGGVFELENGEPNGVFQEYACNVLMSLFPEVTRNQRKEQIKQAMTHAVRFGLTSVQSNDVFDHNGEEMFALFRELHQEHGLLLRYRHQCNVTDPQLLQTMITTEYQQDGYDQMLALGPLKLFKDGSLGARTALLRHPYHDDPGNVGVEALSTQQMRQLISIAHANRMQVITHVIGDAAMEEVLDHYETVMGKESIPGNPLRHGLVHVQISDMPLLERMAKLRLTALVQPVFLLSDIPIIEQRVGVALARTSYAFGSMDDLGVAVAYGSDSPVESCNPFLGIYAALTRQDLEGFPQEGYYPSERVDLMVAINHYTVGGAFVEFQEHHKGRLLPGFVADMVLLDRDIFTIPKKEIKGIQVEWTMVGGRLVYQRDQ